MPHHAHTSVVLTELSRVFSGEWEVLHVADNLVCTDRVRVVKLPRHPDGEARIRTGLRAALALAHAGLPVLAPLEPDLIRTSCGPLSLWPFRESAELSPAVAREIAAAHSAIPGTHLEDHAPWSPFMRAPQWLAASRAPRGFIERTAALLAAIDALPLPRPRVSAHGDASLANVLATPGGILLIDLDSSGQRPHHWDAACLALNLAASRAPIAAITALISHLPDPAALLPLMLRKHALATVVALLQEPTAESHTVLDARLEELQRWLAGSPPHWVTAALG